MKRQNRQERRLLLLTAKLIKYFLLAIFTFAIVCVLAMSFGWLNTIIMLLPLLGDVFLKATIILLCLMIIAVVLESVR